MNTEIVSEEIREANLEEALTIADRCFDKSWSQERIRVDYRKYIDDQRSFYELALEEEVNLLKYYLHRVEGNVIGLSGLYSYTSAEDSCWLGWFAIDPEKQKLGYGTKVLQFIIERAKALGMQKLFLHTEQDNASARRFYENNGFILCTEVCAWDRELVKYEMPLK